MDKPHSDSNTTSQTGTRPAASWWRTNFNRFFLRGLGIILPTVLTIWLLVVAYQFVNQRIADPINRGIQQVWVMSVPWPRVGEQELMDRRNYLRREGGPALREYNHAVNPEAWLRVQVRRDEFLNWWQSYSLALDLIGLVVAIVLIYIVGLLLGSFIGNRLYRRGEELINRLPLVRRVYPSIKQVTDFVVGDPAKRMQFSRVIAVEYPRKGLWSVGLVTGPTMQSIQAKAPGQCLTVFIPSSPTPFTGYVITVTREDTIDLSISVEDALKFTVSGGVLIPPSQEVAHCDETSATSTNDLAQAEDSDASSQADA